MLEGVPNISVSMFLRFVFYACCFVQKRFQKGLRHHGKNFFQIRKELLPTKETVCTVVLLLISCFRCHCDKSLLQTNAVLDTPTSCGRHSCLGICRSGMRETFCRYVTRLLIHWVVIGVPSCLSRQQQTCAFC